MGYFRRRKSGVLKSNKTFTKVKFIRYNKGIKQPSDKMGKYAKPPTLQKVIQLINSKVSSIVENKKSANFEVDSVVLNYTTISGPIWFNTGTTYSTMWNMQNGTGEQERIGNRYKVKKWLIKGFIYPNFTAVNIESGSAMADSFQGKVTVYLGKLTNGNQLPQSLSLLFQNGNTDVDPVGKVKEQLFPINTDKYKIYWKRSFNVGCSQPNTNQYTAPSSPGGNQPVANLPVNVYSNNDLRLHSQFTINVLNYIGKNATIKFNDGDQTAYIPSTMKGLTLFATFAPFVNDLATSNTPNSFYKIWSNSFYEYEDA